MSENKTNWTIGYKEFKNYLHNELGVSKEQLDEMIKETVQNEINDLMGNNGNMIRQAIKEIIREEMVNAMNSDKYPSRRLNIFDYRENNEFKKFVSETMKEEILNIMREQFNVSVDITHNEDSD